MADEKCKVCGEVEFHLNHFAFVGNVPISGGHAFEPVAAGRQEPRVVSKPPCHVCGEPMTVKEWKCRCGATTGCSEPSAPKVEPLCDCNKCRLARGAHPFFDGNHDACSKPEPVAGTQVEPCGIGDSVCGVTCSLPKGHEGKHRWKSDGHEWNGTTCRVAGTASAPPEMTTNAGMLISVERYNALLQSEKDRDSNFESIKSLSSFAADIEDTLHAIANIVGIEDRLDPAIIEAVRKLAAPAGHPQPKENK